MTIELKNAKVITLRNTSDNHFKFYTVKRACGMRAVTMVWGRIGSRGQKPLRLFFDSKDEATSFVMDKVFSKLDRGYRVSELIAD